MEILSNGQEFTLRHGNDVILHSAPGQPMIYVGTGREQVDMYRGNFKIEDYLIERRPLSITSAQQTDAGLVLDLEGVLTATVSETDGAVTLQFVCKDDRIDRFWLRVCADADEHCYGCGEQMSYLDLRGRHFPLWSSEPGVGRDKTTYITWRSDVENGGARRRLL